MIPTKNYFKDTILDNFVSINGAMKKRDLPINCSSQVKKVHR